MLANVNCLFSLSYLPAPRVHTSATSPRGHTIAIYVISSSPPIKLSLSRFLDCLTFVQVAVQLNTLLYTKQLKQKLFARHIQNKTKLSNIWLKYTFGNGCGGQAKNFMFFTVFSLLLLLLNTFLSKWQYLLA